MQLYGASTIPNAANSGKIQPAINVHTHVASSQPHGIIVRLNARAYALPNNIATKSSFQKSKLGVALNSGKVGNCVELSDGTLVRLVAPGELSIEPQNITESLSPQLPLLTTDEGVEIDGFVLLMEHLQGHKPLEWFGFRSINDAYNRLVAELELWSFPKNSVELPYRLWTKTRWTDLTGMYALNKADVEFLKMEPVALQLDDGDVQGIKVLQKSTMQTARVELLEIVADMVSSDRLLSRVSGIFEYSGYKVVLLDAYIENAEAATAKLVCDTSRYSLESDCVTSPTGGNISTTNPGASGNDIASNSSVVQQTSNSEELAVRYASQILIKLPGSNKTITYDFPRNECLRVPGASDYALFYVRGDRHVFCFSPNFSLEVQEFTDTLTGLKKIRCGLSRVGHEIRAMQPSVNMVPNTPSPQTTAASVMNLFKAGTQTAPKKEAWQCYHPVFGTKYSSGMKNIKELGEVQSVKFYPWGSLLTLATTDSPFAMLLIEQPRLRKTYGEKIVVCVRGFTHAGVNRKDVDVAVTAGLERVYLCCCSQIASAGIMPQASRVDFEIQETPNKKYRLRLVHIDIPEGAPSGVSLGSLSALGLLAEFHPRSGVYYQNAYSKQICPRYTIAIPAGFQTDNNITTASTTANTPDVSDNSDEEDSE